MQSWHQVPNSQMLPKSMRSQQPDKETTVLMEIMRHAQESTGSLRTIGE